MKYHVYAKFLGSYMPEKRARVGECLISKSYIQYEIDDDRADIPTRSKSSEFHCAGQGVKNYIYYPQDLISVRTFESEYIITTEVEAHSEHDAIETATERFSDVAVSMSLVAKNKTVTINGRRLKRPDEIYDFEIVGIFLKKNKRLVRLKLPRPFINGHNFFPRKIPKGFLVQAKKYIDTRDRTLKKGLIYFYRATAMRDSGVFSELETILNFVKCIELICWHVAEDDRLGLTKKEFEKTPSKEIIEHSGSKIRVPQKTIDTAKKMWNVRNKGDIAHKDLYYNPYSRKSSNSLVNYRELESVASEFLIKYCKYREINPKPYF